VRVDCSCGRGSVEDYYMALSSLYKICEREGASLVYGESTLLGMVYDTWFSELVSNLAHLQCMRGTYLHCLHVRMWRFGVERIGSRIALFLYERCVNRR